MLVFNYSLSFVLAYMCSSLCEGVSTALLHWALSFYLTIYWFIYLWYLPSHRTAHRCSCPWCYLLQSRFPSYTVLQLRLHSSLHSMLIIQKAFFRMYAPRPSWPLVASMMLITSFTAISASPTDSESYQLSFVIRISWFYAKPLLSCLHSTYTFVKPLQEFPSPDLPPWTAIRMPNLWGCFEWARSLPLI